MTSNWKRKIRRDKSGRAEPTVDNIVYILLHDPPLAGTCRKNTFTGKIESNPGITKDVGLDPIWTDDNQAMLEYYLAKNYGMKKCNQALITAVQTVANKARYNPVQDYLLSLQPWDGVKRIATMLIDYLGVDDTDYCRTVSERWMAAAVARILQPGFKFDSVLLISGPQGIGKSTFFQKLAVKPSWFTDNIGDMGSKESFENITGVWIVELSELSAMRRSDIETIKAFLSRTSDRFRNAYGHFVNEQERTAVFVGTTNDDSFLVDPTGNRRFWCLKVTKKATKSVWDDLSKEIPQLWAEALTLYRAHQNDGDWFGGADIRMTTEEEAAKFREVDPWIALIQSWLDTKIPEGFYGLSISERHDYFDPNAYCDHAPGPYQRAILRQRVCPQEILNECLLKPKAQQTSQDIRRVNKVMQEMPGWQKIGAYNTKGYGTSRGYERIEISAENP